MMLKKCKDIIYNSGVVNIIGNENIIINFISANSKHLQQNSMYIAVKGSKIDGHIFIAEAIKAGATAIICEKLPDTIENNITYIKVKNTSYALGIIASNFFDNPSSKLKLIGITGTNGKTTIATLLYNLFMKLNYKVGLISTIINKINTNEINATHTTPDPISLNKLLKNMLNEGCTHCFMEVSSHAIVQNRIAGLQFQAGVFTNISQDHLDYHKTYEEYIKAKKKFFDNLNKDAFALSNIDDRNGDIMLQNTKAKKYFYSINKISDFKGKILENSFNGLLMYIANKEFWTRLIGKFNAYNIIAVYATALLLGEDTENVLTILSNIKGAEGRFDYVVNEEGIIGIVDYAHTPDALNNVLSTIIEITEKQGDIITVVGAGGDRDKSKRPLMGEIACKLSQKIIFTSDNPRSEEPMSIIEDMQKGVDIINKKKLFVLPDRKEAIKTACAFAKAGDVVLIAGKGHEKYQEIKGVKRHFDDMELIKEFLNIKF